MTYYGGKEMAASFRTVRDNTIKIAEEVPDNKYDFAPAPDCRTIGKTLVHIALTPGFQTHIHTNRITDLKQVNFPELFQKLMADEAKPRTKSEIIALLKSEGDNYAAFLEGLDESFLAERVAAPQQAGAGKTRFEMLLSPKEHEMHHRAQLMTMQRLIGQVPHLTRQFQERMAAAQQSAAQR
jgi:uncharacterized damage-inducible protein DinB